MKTIFIFLACAVAISLGVTETTRYWGTETTLEMPYEQQNETELVQLENPDGETDKVTTEMPYEETNEEVTTEMPYEETNEEVTTTTEMPYEETNEEVTTTTEMPYEETNEEVTTEMPYEETNEEVTAEMPFEETSENITREMPYNETSEEVTTEMPSFQETNNTNEYNTTSDSDNHNGTATIHVPRQDGNATTRNNKTTKPSPLLCIPCRDGSACVDFPQLCDLTPHCQDGSDEDTSFCKQGVSVLVCANGQFIQGHSLRCNGYLDCDDGSDEMGCLDFFSITFGQSQTFIKPCSWQYQFQCGEGTCIDKSKVCDGVEDCPFGVDESVNQCAASQLQPPYGDNLSGFYKTYTCDNGQVLVSRSQVKCDGNIDCNDASDEVDCRLSNNNSDDIDCDEPIQGEGCNQYEDESLKAECQQQQLNKFNACNPPNEEEDRSHEGEDDQPNEEEDRSHEGEDDQPKEDDDDESGDDSQCKASWGDDGVHIIISHNVFVLVTSICALLMFFLSLVIFAQCMVNKALRKRLLIVQLRERRAVCNESYRPPSYSVVFGSKTSTPKSVA